MGLASFHGKIHSSMTITPNTLFDADLERRELELQDHTLKKNPLSSHGPMRRKPSNSFSLKIRAT